MGIVVRYSKDQIINAIRQEIAPEGLQSAKDETRNLYYMVAGVLDASLKQVSISTEQTPESKLQLLMQFIFSLTGVPPEKIKALSRKDEYITARHAYFYLAAKWELASLSTVGLLAGGRDHTTVIHGRDTIQDRIDTNDPLVSWVKDVYERGNEKLSISKMTFSHQMIRLLFIEQLYRACTILKGEKYHHE